MPVASFWRHSTPKYLGRLPIAGAAIALQLCAACGDPGGPSNARPLAASPPAAALAPTGAGCIQFVEGNLIPVGARACRLGADGLRIYFKPFGLVQFRHDDVELTQGFFGDRGEGALVSWVNGDTLANFTFAWTHEGIPSDSLYPFPEIIAQANRFLLGAAWIRSIQFTKGGVPFGPPTAVKGDRPNWFLFYYLPADRL